MILVIEKTEGGNQVFKSIVCLCVLLSEVSAMLGQTYFVDLVNQ